jgi:hypothetical protein
MNNKPLQSKPSCQICGNEKRGDLHRACSSVPWSPT